MNRDVKNSIVRRLEFARAELADLQDYFAMDYRSYQTDRVSRRNVERIVENAVNAVCDVGKLVLSQHDSPMPESYRDIFSKLADLGFVDFPLSDLLITATRLRNVLAHQYLDIKWEYVKRFLEEGAQGVSEFLALVENWLSDR